MTTFDRSNNPREIGIRPIENNRTELFDMESGRRIAGVQGISYDLPVNTQIKMITVGMSVNAESITSAEYKAKRSYKEYKKKGCAEIHNAEDFFVDGYLAGKAAK